MFLRLSASAFALLSVGRSDVTFNAMKVAFTQASPKTWSQNLARYRSTGASQGVLFYEPGDAAKTYIEEVFDPLALKLTHVVRMMAVDCKAHAKHCTEQDPSESFKLGPTVVVYPPLPRPHRVLANEAPKEDVLKALVSVIPRNNVETLNVANFDTFIDNPEHATIPKAIFFGNKKSAPPSFHSIANSTHDRVNFAFINASDEGNDAIVQRILGTDATFPSVALYRVNKFEVYDGDITSAVDLFEWINIHAETFVKGGGFSGGATPEQPWLKELIPELTKDSNGAVCFKTSGLCAVYVTNATELQNSEREMLEDLVKITAPANKNDAKLKFSWLSTAVETKVADSLGLGDFTEPHFMLINTKRMRYTTPVQASRDVMLREIESLNAGNQRFKAIKGKKIPIFINRENVVVHDEL